MRRTITNEELKFHIQEAKYNPCWTSHSCVTKGLFFAMQWSSKVNQLADWEVHLIITSFGIKRIDEAHQWHIWHLFTHSPPIIVTYFYLIIFSTCNGFLLNIFSTQRPRKVCIANRNIGQFLFKIIWSFIPFYFLLVISAAVGISVPFIFCILKFLLIQIYLRSGTLIALLLWLYSL